MLQNAQAQTVWRSDDFARFEIGRLPDGREEWLEFWIRNHLLGDFAGLVEICRRAYKRHAMEIDRADKQDKLKEH